MKILVFDNYDSFTYNLVHLVEKITHIKVDVFRNDQIGLEKVKDYDKVILSPGPGIPTEAGLLLPLIKEYAASKSILGVCINATDINPAAPQSRQIICVYFRPIFAAIKGRKKANTKVTTL